MDNKRTGSSSHSDSLKRVNIIGALSTGHFVTACLQESVTGEYFYAYVMGVAKQIKENTTSLSL